MSISNKGWNKAKLNKKQSLTKQGVLRYLVIQYKYFDLV